jgi:pimeloyl-ACP methyl ester carboxylesterase
VRIGLAAVMVAVVASTALGAVPSRAEGRCADPGNATPVLLVHGFTGTVRSWDFLAEQIEKTGAATSRLDYEDVSTEWVTHPKIGGALADTIVCLADKSSAAGGSGKVVVVAHSMGGLAVREAASLVRSGKQVSARIGFVITIGTPTLGSSIAGMTADSVAGSAVRLAQQTLLRLVCLGGSAVRGRFAQACDLFANSFTPAARALTVGSWALRDLPLFDPKLPVLAIGGELTLTRQVLFWEQRGPEVGDVVVDLNSATAYHAHPDGGGGKAVIDCELFLFPPWPGGECSHGALLQNHLVAARVIRALRGFVESTQADISLCAAFFDALNAGAESGVVSGAVGDAFDVAQVEHLLPDGSVLFWNTSMDVRYHLGRGVFGPVSTEEYRRLATQSLTPGLVGVILWDAEKLDYECVFEGPLERY